MKRLFETADLEAELFGEEKAQTEEFLQEYDLTELTAEDMADLENLSVEDVKDFPSLEISLELEDGSILAYELAAVFAHGEMEYVGLHPKGDTEGEFQIMRLLQGEDDEIVLQQIEDEEELQTVFEVFCNLYRDVEVEKQENIG